MADQTARLEAATVRAEVGSSILYRFSNDGVSEDPIPTASGDITNLKKVILDIQTEGANKISFATQIYATTAAGIAATTNGAIFLVRSSDPDEIYAVYSNNSGTAVDTGKRALSAEAVITATDAAQTAADNAQAAATTATARVAGFHSPSATDPTSRDDGSALQIGDTYFNTADQTNKTFATIGWVVSSVSGTELASAIATRQPTLPSGSSTQFLRGSDKTFVSIVKGNVGLGNVDNTSDVAKPVSTAQQAAIDLKANANNPAFTGTATGLTKAMVGLSNADNTSDANKPVSTAQAAALALKAGAGANSDITSLSGITTPLSVAQGGIGGNTPAAAKLNLGLAAVVNTVADLQALPKTGTRLATILGYSVLGDTGAANYYLDIADTTSPAGPRIVVATDGGRWKLASSGFPTFAQQGTNPALGNDAGYLMGYTGSSSGLQGNGNRFNYYEWRVTADDVSQVSGQNGASGSKVNAGHISMMFGGANAKGGRHGIEVDLEQTAITNAASTDRNYCAIQGLTISLTGDGGTSSSDVRGEYFALSGYTRIGGSAAYVHNITGCELNTEIVAGSGTRVAFHSGMQIASLIGERGFQLDTAMSLGCLGGSSFGWKYGIATHAMNGRPTFDSDSTFAKLFPTGGATMLGLIDATGVGFTGPILKTNTVSVDQTAIEMTNSNANLKLGSNSASSTPFIYWRSSGVNATYDARLIGVGGNGTTANGTLQCDAAVLATPIVRPLADNTYSCGTAALKYSVVYSNTGAINTSDAREKTEVRRLEDRELDAAKLLGKEIGAFQFLEAIKAKGDDARLHIGMTVQRAIEVMEGCGLDPMNYSFICYDEWEATDEVTSEDEEGNITVVSPATEAGDRYGFRMDQLLAFIAAGFEARLSDLESR